MKKLLSTFIVITVLVASYAAQAQLIPFFSPSGFNPTQLSGLQAWLDASDTSTITESGGAVSQWDDKSTAGRDFTQGTGSRQPTTGSSTINSLNALAFDGADLLLRNEAWLYDLSGKTIFVVSKGASQLQKRIFAEDSGSSGDPRVLYLVTGDTDGTLARAVYRDDGGNYRLQTNGTQTAFDNTAHVVTITDDNSTYISYVDGVEDINQGYSHTTTTQDKTGVGADPHTAADGFTGDVAEIIVYSRVLSASERTAVENYLTNKWGI